MKREESRGSWYLLTGLIIGIFLGIFYSRNILPVSYIDTSPDSLRREDKDRLQILIASAYLSNGDLVRARARLELLGDQDISRTLTEQAQRTLAEDGASSEAQALGLLALALGEEPSGLFQSVPQQLDQPSVTLTPAGSGGLVKPGQMDPTSPTNILQMQDEISEAVISPVAMDSISRATYILSSKLEVCDQSLVEPLIQIEVVDQTGNPIAGVPAKITWPGGEELFYTGLKPEKGIGYADYTLNPDFIYSLNIGENGSELSEIRPILCRNTAGSSYWGILSLKYSVP